VPITYERDDARCVVTVTIDGAFDLREIIATLNRQASEDSWHYARLYDHRHIQPPPTNDDVRGLLDAVRRHIREYGPRGPVAVVADQPAVYGMVRMYMTLADEEPAVAVFRDVPAARVWLAERGF
jgi:hypothetical protein